MLRGLLFGAPGQGAELVLRYTASEQAVRTLLQGVERFNDALQRRHERQIRRPQGAIFSFKAEQGDGTIEVFITDWSPVPAACAVAVQLSPSGPTRVTARPGRVPGTFVRHPLTGDLLPVWVCSWVKPDFGTGAVLVNPAHDAHDLRFARAVGLPIRFALVPEDFDGSPNTWPSPPVIKSGRTARTGAYDGLTPSEAAAAYFDALRQNGFDRVHADVKIPSVEIARIRSRSGAFDHAGHFRRIALGVDEEHAVAQIVREFDVEPSSALRTVLDSRDCRKTTLVASRSDGETALLAYRLLRADLRKADPDGSDDPQELRVIVVHDVSLAKVDARTASLVTADASEAAVVRPGQIEQVQAFRRRHAQLLVVPTVAGTSTPGSLPSLVRTLLQELKFGQAFAQLAKWQRQLLAETESRTLTDGSLEEYVELSSFVIALPEAVTA